MIVNDRSFFLFTKLVTDVCIIIFSFLVALFISDNNVLPDFYIADFGFILFLIAGWYFTSKSNSLYQERVQENQIREIYKTFNNIIWQLILAVLFIFAIKEKDYTRSFVLLYGALLFILMPSARIVLKQVYLLLYKKGRLRKSALIIGGGDTSVQFSKYLRENKHQGYHLVRYIPGTLSLANNLENSYKGRGLLVDGVPLTGLEQIDEVFISEDHQATYSTKEVASVLSMYAVRLRIIPNMYNMYFNGKYSFSMLGGFPLLSYRSEPLEDVYNRVVKRAFDVIFSLFVIVFIFSWLFPIIAIAIKLTSKGPVFYLQERWGKRNKPFMCIKFRSMKVASSDIGKNGKFRQAGKDDDRITKVGGFLRKSSLDELPQFFNVLFGEMSVVGPRPHATLMNQESINTVKNYMVRHQTKPGITGWAQVNGLRGELTEPSMMNARTQHDIWYIENWSFALDLRIIFLTFWRMVIGDKQAY
ncbi:undecaprenyl-phosphate glucose phosphotransferase [Olivibacter sitiensis]|uniref:undecaprenyl-phosphate glucose phosphotransferase n=1 Tax=Olivibacter sitiensis TaxID=376470 RepID=UPI00041E4010|nr:undecaprenyl-phosphate glucose phosphotransferase [Olivibacter sitiensis]